MAASPKSHRPSVISDAIVHKHVSSISINVSVRVSDHQEHLTNFKDEYNVRGFTRYFFEIRLIKTVCIIVKFS